VTHEESLHKEMKLKSLGIASLQRSIARQESRILWLSIGVTPMKLFHIHANARWSRKFIRSIKHEGQVIMSEERKAETFLNFFDDLLGSPSSRTHALDLDRLHLSCLDLVTLEERFTEEEVWSVITSLSSDKPPSPDGFCRPLLLGRLGDYQAGPHACVRCMMAYGLVELPQHQ
jgi:hypothetical protein